jgi:hypothetical protein
VTLAQERVEARGKDAQFRLSVHDKMRAFAFAGGAEGAGPIVLGLPKVRSALETAKAFAALGPDEDAIDAAHRGDELFDFGLGRESARFCVRTSNPDLVALLRGLEGREWGSALQSAGAQILAESPHRVVESALARVEVFSAIPAPGAVSPGGAHTHFLPTFLASGDEAPAGLALPAYAQQVAIFYPAAGKPI